MSKLRSIGRCVVSGQPQIAMQHTFSSWGASGSTVSTLNQVYKALAHYPANWQAACLDSGLPKPLCRISMAPWMSPIFKGLPGIILQSECIAQVFARVDVMKGNEPYKFEDGKMLGTWNSPTTQVWCALCVRVSLLFPICIGLPLHRVLPTDTSEGDGNELGIVNTSMFVCHKYCGKQIL
jgi:hypothetical protein